jgi:transposase
MITIGTDFHKRTSTYQVRDERGKQLQRKKLENRPELITEFLEQFPGPKRLAMEATRNWGLFYETVKPHVDEFLLGHPRRMKQITESQTKNDPQDADLICQMAMGPFFPKAYVPGLDCRQMRSLLRFRNFLVRQRKGIRNQIQILLDRNLWPYQRPLAFKDPFCKRGLKWLRSVALPERERFILDRSLQAFGQLSQQIAELESFVEAQSLDHPDLPYLRRVPGFRKSKINTYIVLFELDDIHRFRKAKHFAHYAGLIPSEHSSGDKHRTGRLVKDANHFLRTALIESTLAALRQDKGLKLYYQSVKQRAGSGAAIIACARKLSHAVYHVLKNKMGYQPYQPSVTTSHPLSVPAKG